MILSVDFDGFSFFSDAFLDAGYQILRKNPMNKGVNQAGSQNIGNASRDIRKDEKNKINSSDGARGSKGGSVHGSSHNAGQNQR